MLDLKVSLVHLVRMETLAPSDLRDQLEHPVRLVCPAFQASRETSAPLESLEQLALLERKETAASQETADREDPQDQLESLVLRDLLVHPASPDPWERLAFLDLLVNPEAKDLWDHLGLLVLREAGDLRGSRVTQAPLVTMAQRDPQDLRVSLDHVVLRDPRETQVPLAPLDLEVLLVWMERLDLWDHKDQLDQRENLE